MVRVLARLGCTGASSTLGVRLKNRRPLFTVKNWAADFKKNLQGYVGGLHNM